MDDQKRDGKLTAADERLTVYADKASDDELSDADLDGVAGGQAASEEDPDDGTQSLSAKK